MHEICLYFCPVEARLYMGCYLNLYPFLEIPNDIFAVLIPEHVEKQNMDGN